MCIVYVYVHVHTSNDVVTVRAYVLLQKHVYGCFSSNPIWLEKHDDQGWPRDRDSDTDSRNSLDENDVVSGFKGYDEHERTMNVYNDDFGGGGGGAGDSEDAVLKAALAARKQQNTDSASQSQAAVSRGSNPASPNSVRSHASHRNNHSSVLPPATTPNGTVKSRSNVPSNPVAPYLGNQSHSHSNQSAADHTVMNIAQPSSSKPHADIFDNRGFEMEATEI